MATLEEMQKMGYGPKKNGMEQIASLLGGFDEGQQKRAEQKTKDTEEQSKLYVTLREAGYSSEDATARVNRTYRSTGFLEDMMSGKHENVFNPSSTEDKVGLEAAKTKADIGKTVADTKKSNEQADYYKRGGAAANKYAGLTPNQIQMRIKDLRSQLYMTGDPEDDTMIQSEIQYLNDLFNKKSGYGNSPDGTETPPADGAAGAAGEKIIMTDPSGKKYRVLKANVEAAKKLGLK